MSKTGQQLPPAAQRDAVVGARAASPTERSGADLHRHMEASQAGAGDSSFAAAAEFPHRAAIEASFGSSLGATAYVGGAAAKATADRGTTAYALGNQVAFAKDPDLHTAAHEAAHVLQAGGRVQAYTPVGGAHDPLEQHANAAADLVVAGKSAAHLFAHRGPATSSPVAQNYTQTIAMAPEYKTAGGFENPTGWSAANAKLRVSNDQRMLIGQSPTHDLWADPALIVEADAQLKAVDSKISLRAGDHELKPKRGVPGAPGHPLKKVEAFHRYQAAEDRAKNGLKTPGDCGVTAHEIMGAAGPFHGAEAEYHLAGKHHHSDPEDRNYTPAHAKHAIWHYFLFKAGLEGGTPTVEESMLAYAKLAPAEREEVDRELGINHHAHPKVGQAYSTGSFGKDAPFLEDAGLFRAPKAPGEKGYDPRLDPPDPRIWGFHYAGVIMQSGGDSVTLENFAMTPDWSPNTAWSFNMYGAEAGQTFHDEMIDGKTFGMAGPGGDGIAAITLLEHKRER